MGTAEAEWEGGGGSIITQSTITIALFPHLKTKGPHL